MKSRLSGTIWMLIAFNAAAYAAAIWLAFNAGKQTGSGSSELTGVFIAGGVALASSIILFWRLGGVIKPVQQMARFSEPLSPGGSRGRADVQSNPDFCYIADK